MSKPKYCLGCKDALTSEEGYSVAGGGLFTHNVAILYYCENLACSRYGLLARLGLNKKPDAPSSPDNQEPSK